MRIDQELYAIVDARGNIGRDMGGLYLFEDERKANITANQRVEVTGEYWAVVKVKLSRLSE